MASILSGKEVVAALNEKMRAEVEGLKAAGITPTLAIVRVGERPDDVSYERGAMKRAETVGVAARQFTLPAETTEAELLAVIEQINTDTALHGLLLFRPLPKHIDEEKVRNAISPQKDVDGITDIALAGVFTGSGYGYPPCTAQACLEIFDHYGIELKGKRVTMIGRSLVVGKPLAMMMLARHATVTICHTRTVDMPGVCREAEILIVAAGKAKVVGAEFFAPGQIVLDVGINVDDEGNLVGDADYEAAQSIVEAITPVPGGVGTVTTSVLLKHVIAAAK
ncbi:MAG: bifunctional 5,10-methylene-tetrahydrofolate dehydrogenase/5,10-methylene-tetrahydrofolate cyclohydrolase [Clostridiales bacterium]|nr:bifunctional 5,10-methylene-tetrahydrofolate dehydrogenase/5,10-methylene-tetrahydrofolate cyclohydrolase [Clostridiales bacterium]